MTNVILKKEYLYGDVFMVKEPLKKEHIQRLTDYDINNINVNESVLLRFQPGEAILRQGLPMEYLMLVFSGKAKTYSALANGKDMLLFYYISDGIIGDIELMTNSFIASSTMIAITEFVCIGLPYSKYAHILKENISFVNRVGKELAIKLLRSSRNGVFTALHAGEERLCAYILQTEQQGLFTGNWREVSSSLGLSYRHMLRIFSRLCVDGILEKSSGGYRIINYQELENRAPQFYME